MLARVRAILPLLVALLVTSHGVLAEQTLPAAPPNYVLDEPDLLSARTEHHLSTQLRDFELRTTNEIVVAVFSSLPADEQLESYTAKLGHSWGLGTKERDNGIILFLFAKERQARLEIGYGLEGVVPDSVADRILREHALPAFRKGDYDGGVQAAVRAIMRATEAEYQADRSRSPGVSSDGRLWFIMLVFLVFVVWTHMGDTVLQRNGRYYLWQIFDLIRLLAVMSSSGSHGSREDSRGGGGDFGGGGASGRW
jgi:uncharacterized protein